MARGRAAGYDEQHKAILAQAARLFARQGYPATSMNQVAEACGLSKATLYHYFRDKYSMLVSIADEHVSHLQALVREPVTAGASPRQQLEQLILRIVAAYADAVHAHHVLTEDVRFLEPSDQARVLDKEREVVAVFSRAVAAVRPEVDEAGLAKPLTMLLFGMVNWMFTWMKPEGPLTHEAMAPIVADLFLGGLSAVQVEPAAETVARDAGRPARLAGASLAGR